MADQVIQVKEICATSLPEEQQEELKAEAQAWTGFTKMYKGNGKWWALINTRIADSRDSQS